MIEKGVGGGLWKSFGRDRGGASAARALRNGLHWRM